MTNREAISILVNLIKPPIIRNDGKSQTHLLALEAIALAVEALKTEPIVRCKDCKRNHTEECSMWYESDDHQEQYSWNNPDDYCSRGERKDEVEE